MNTEGEILHLWLEGLVVPGHTLALNMRLGTLSELVVQQGQPYLCLQRQFTASETSVLLPLLTAYPYFCPHETLYASFTYGTVTEQTLERCRQQLRAAVEQGVWDQEMRTVRNVLSRVRFKLRDFHIGIAALLETGYIVKALTPKHGKKE